jgi:hypothetical protein
LRGRLDFGERQFLFFLIIKEVLAVGGNLGFAVLQILEIFLAVGFVLFAGVVEDALEFLGDIFTNEIF